MILERQNSVSPSIIFPIIFENWQIFRGALRLERGPVPRNPVLAWFLMVWASHCVPVKVNLCKARGEHIAESGRRATQPCIRTIYEENNAEERLGLSLGHTAKNCQHVSFQNIELKTNWSPSKFPHSYPTAFHVHAVVWLKFIVEVEVEQPSRNNGFGSSRLSAHFGTKNERRTALV